MIGNEAPVSVSAAVLALVVAVKVVLERVVKWDLVLAQAQGAALVAASKARLLLNKNPPFLLLLQAEAADDPQPRRQIEYYGLNFNRSLKIDLACSRDLEAVALGLAVVLMQVSVLDLVLTLVQEVPEVDGMAVLVASKATTVQQSVSGQVGANGSQEASGGISGSGSGSLGPLKVSANAGVNGSESTSGNGSVSGSLGK
ncbi:unnamed protein product [Spodoptera exigua]|nr:unnamed protein product [Spodoptera exigua]